MRVTCVGSLIVRAKKRCRRECSFRAEKGIAVELRNVLFLSSPERGMWSIYNIKLF